MLDELQRRNYAQNTVRAYIHAVEDFAKYFHRSPDRLGSDHIREYQVHLFRDCKLSAGTIEGRTAALRFLFVKTLRRPYLPDHIPFPKRQRRLPTVLSQKEVARLIASAQNLMHRTNDLAPISDAAWARIGEETSRTFKRHLVMESLNAQNPSLCAMA